MARHVRRGDRVVAATLTHGLRVHDVVIAEELRFQEKTPDPERLEALMEERSKVKNSELIEALGILGITEVRFLHYDDSILLKRSFPVTPTPLCLLLGATAHHHFCAIPETCLWPSAGAPSRTDIGSPSP